MLKLFLVLVIILSGSAGAIWLLFRMQNQDEFLGTRVITGELIFEHGDQPWITGILIRSDSFEGSESMKQWEGKQIEVKGTLYRYTCTREEQCLEEGYIDYLEGVEYVKEK